MLIWQFSCMAVKLFDNFPVWLWAQKSILFIFYCRHGLQMEIFPVKIIWDVFDNFPVWLWTFLTIFLCGHDPTNLSAKSLTIFLCGFLTIFLSGFLTIFLSGFLTIFRFPYVSRKDNTHHMAHKSSHDVYLCTGTS